MVKIVKIGDITLENPLFVLESFDIKHVKAVSFETLGGGKIVYESIKRDSSNNLTLDSKDNGWIKENTVNDIVNLADDLGVTVVLTTDEAQQIEARFRIEEGDTIRAEELYEGSEWYRVTIKMAMV